MKNIKLITILTLGLFINCSHLFAQDPLVFQYDNLPILLNPALTANNQDYHRISSNLRNQWADNLGDASYKSGVLTMEYGFGERENDHFGIGLLTIIERAGSTNLGTTQFKPTISYNRLLAKSQKSKALLSVGSGFGPARISLDESNLRWPSPTEPVAINDKKWYFDLGLGLNFNYILNDRLNLNIGISSNHLNQPNISLIPNNTSSLKQSTNLYAIAEMKINKSFSFIPNLLIYRTGDVGYELYGLKNRLNLNKNALKFIQLGFQYLPNSASTSAWNAEAKISQFLLSLSIGNTKFQDSNNSQTYELGISYFIKREKPTKDI